MGTRHADLVRDTLIEAGYPGTTTGQKSQAHKVIVRGVPPKGVNAVKRLVRSVYRYRTEYTTPAPGYLVIELGQGRDV